MDRLDIMRLFVRIVERGSFAQAARDLQIPRPTATHAIQRLERDLGVRLLERTTRAVRPTLDGLFYRDRCLRLLADLEEIETAFRQSAPQGPLRVDLQGTIARFFILPALPDFVRRYPGIALSLSEGDRLVDLVAEGVDCVVRAGDPAVPSLIGRRIALLPQATLASPDYLQRHGTPQTPDDLPGHRMVGYSAAATGRAYPLDFTIDGRVKEVALPHDVLVRGAELYTAAGLAGFGLFQVPRYRVRAPIAAGDLVPILEAFAPPPVPVWALYPQNRHLAPRLRVFLDWLIDLFDQPATRAMLAEPM